MKIVLDTNVLISGLLNPSGIPAMVLQLILGGKVILLLDVRIPEEYSEVLRRPKFGFREEWINPLLDFFRFEGQFIPPEPVNYHFPDPDDAMFYEVAKAGEARYLVIGNARHFPDEEMVISPKDFVERVKD